MNTIVLKICAKCGKPGCTKRCDRCKFVYYCEKSCQEADWKNHKLGCGKETAATAVARVYRENYNNVIHEFWQMYRMEVGKDKDIVVIVNMQDATKSPDVEPNNMSAHIVDAEMRANIPVFPDDGEQSEYPRLYLGIGKVEKNTPMTWYLAYAVDRS